eukprot:gnl/TRDRNA2_/TRDRNA2_136522_c1_seq1.p1 gnl/TRDRNA2_/TRDRNA2_136522_c1~~gnl/TRDRNA2_/TRDRNA2_136522_c1_seq1.p1  ORF type:complete len:116 (+),score=29.72 gnl/TRDRNA2_/TRDRNA2_136522_c1_seq1:2-349(+)
MNTLKDRKARAYLQLQGLDVQDAELFFNMVANSSEDREVHIDSFAEALLRMKGCANAMDVQALMFETKRNERQHIKLHDALSAKIDRLSQALVHEGPSQRSRSADDHHGECRKAA